MYMRGYVHVHLYMFRQNMMDYDESGLQMRALKPLGGGVVTAGSL